MADGGVVEIRRYNRSTDLRQLETFRCARYGEKWSRSAQKVIRNLPAAVEADADICIFVADDANAVVGAAVYGPETGFTDRDIIYSLGVILSRQRQGIGTLLKESVMAESAGRQPSRAVVSQVHRKNLLG